MNLMLLWDNEIRADNTVRLASTDRRSRHIQQVLRLQIGDSLRAGLVNGPLGTATLKSLNTESLIFVTEFPYPPPSPLDTTLILGLPRPKMMRRIVQCVSAMGVKDLIFIHTYKVEKSFWQTPWLSPVNLKEQSLLGLEQAVDTQLPDISQFRRFKPFVEDHLPLILSNREGWFAHPGIPTPLPQTPPRMVLAIGPEGGFTPYEVSKLSAAGLRGFNIGGRILRMETAIPALLGRFYL